MCGITGGLVGPVESLHDQLLDLIANIEAGLDFVEGDIEFVSRDEIGRAREGGHAREMTINASDRPSGRRHARRIGCITIMTQERLPASIVSNLTGTYEQATLRSKAHVKR